MLPPLPTRLCIVRTCPDGITARQIAGVYRRAYTPTTIHWTLLDASSLFDALSRCTSPHDAPSGDGMLSDPKSPISINLATLSDVVASGQSVYLFEMESPVLEPNDQ